MTSTILRNPYAAILRAIWSIIIEISQGTANTLAHWLSPFRSPKTSQHHEYTIPDSGAANPLGLLHPCKWGCGMTRKSLHQSYFKILQRIPLVDLLHLGETELKLYIFLLAEADEQSKAGEREWCWKPFNLYEVLDISRSTFSRAISSLQKRGLVESTKGIMMGGYRDGKIIMRGTRDGRVEVVKENSWQLISEEKIVRDHLMSFIGGQPEVSTPVGRIDLLTNTEIIEVKRVADWKSAMGQVLAYANFYPEHTKRIHLFGLVAPSADALAICSQMGIVVTIEEVSNE